MRLSFFTEHCSLSDRQEAYARRKLEHLEHLWSRVADEATTVRVEFRVESLKATKSRLVCLVNVALPGKKILRGEAHGQTPEEAIDLVADVLRRQIEKDKTATLRRRDKRRS